MGPFLPSTAGAPVDSDNKVVQLTSRLVRLIGVGNSATLSLMCFCNVCKGGQLKCMRIAFDTLVDT